MKFLGSKNKYAKYILPLILKDRQPNQYVVEPFCGGCNLTQKITGNRIANDCHYYLIEVHKAIQSGWIPPDTITEEDYRDIKLHPTNYPASLVGFVGFNCSFASKWWGGYARGSFNNIKRNYAREAQSAALITAPLINGVEFYNLSYDKLPIPKNSIIYCDAPYQNTTKYKNSIDYDIYFNWCREKANEGHTVFVSEYNAPFNLIWEKETIVNLNNNKAQARVERLYKVS